MLNYLSIKNFALIEDVMLEFEGGLNALTGETGAGKTIAVEALGLALGDKASLQQLRKGAARLTVTAGFAADSAKVRRFLKELDLDLAKDEDLILRREVDAGGRSRAFINDNPVNVSTLAKLRELLVDFHGQHEHQLLLRPAEQRDLLDSFGGLDKERAAVAAAYVEWKDLAAEQEAISLSEQERAQRIDLYRFQQKELQAAQLKAGEEDELERLLPQLKNAERLKNAAQAAYGLLYADEGSAVDNVRRVQRDLENLQNLGADLAGASEMIQEASVRLEETSRALDAFLGKVDVDPDKLEKVLSRMDLISKLRKKYGPSLQDVIDHQAKVEAELGRLENIEGRTRDLAQGLARAEAKLKEASAALTKGRLAAGKKLAAAAEKEFKDLGLERASLEVSVERAPEGGYSASGADIVQFMFTPNPGEGKQPLAETASGGELSRVMLALKAVLAKADGAATLIFDEIDAGVGGVLGGAIGRKLAKLGKDHQVVCITHLATIAACASAHFSVEKEVKKDRTRTVLKRLSEEERVREIARMFGAEADEAKGGSITLQHARELLASSKP